MTANPALPHIHESGDDDLPHLAVKAAHQSATRSVEV